MREPAPQPAAPASFAPLPAFAAAQTATPAAANIYQLALAQAREQVERKRFEQEISRWN